MLQRRESLTAVEAIGRLGGMQAQGPPVVGLWTRLEGFDSDELRRALADAEVVRATLLRGTLHLFSRRDYGRYRATLQSMLLAAASGNLGASWTASTSTPRWPPLASCWRRRRTPSPSCAPRCASGSRRSATAPSA